MAQEYRELVRAFEGRLSPTARGRFRQRLDATLRFADRDHRYQVREQERDVLGEAPDQRRGSLLRNALAEAKLRELAADTGSVVVVPSRRDRGLMGPGTYAGADGLNPYLLATLAGRHCRQGEAVWEITFAATPVGAFVGTALGFTAAAVIPPRTTASTTEPEEPVVSQFPEAGLSRAPALIIVHLPLVADMWSMTCHVVAGDLDLIFGEGDNYRVVPELAPDLQHYLVGAAQRLAGVHRFLLWLQRRFVAPTTGTTIAVSAPAWDGIPEVLRRAGDELGWCHAERLRVYEESPPDRKNRGDSLRQQVGPRHPGDGSPLPPRIVDVWGVA